MSSATSRACFRGIFKRARIGRAKAHSIGARADLFQVFVWRRRHGRRFRIASSEHGPVREISFLLDRQTHAKVILRRLSFFFLSLSAHPEKVPYASTSVRLFCPPPIRRARRLSLPLRPFCSRPESRLARLPIAVADEAALPRDGTLHVPPHQRSTARWLLTILVDQGMIRKSTSTFSFPSVIRPWSYDDLEVHASKYGKPWSLAVDYRALHEQRAVLVANHSSSGGGLESRMLVYADWGPLPDANFFTRIDLRSGSLRLRLRDEDCRYTAFDTPRGKHEWVVVPYGFDGIRRFFTQSIETLLGSLIGNGAFVTGRMIVVYGSTSDEVVDRVSRVHTLLRSEGMVSKSFSQEYVANNLNAQGMMLREGVSALRSRVDHLEAAARDGTAALQRDALLELVEVWTPASARGTEVAHALRTVSASECAGDRGRSLMQDVVEHVWGAIVADPMPGEGLLVLHVDVCEGRLGVFVALEGGARGNRVVAFGSSAVESIENPQSQCAVAIRKAFLWYRWLFEERAIEVRTSVGGMHEYAHRKLDPLVIYLASLLAQFDASLVETGVCTIARAVGEVGGSLDRADA